MHRIVLFLSFVVLASSQKGLECSDDSGCDKHQKCSFGYCRCSAGFLKVNESCYKDQLKHGDSCDHEVQCMSDHRLACLEDKEGNKACRCFWLYEFDEQLQECTYIKNLTEVLGLLREQWDNIGRIEAEAKKLFFGLVFAGLMAVVLGAVFAGGCVIYGCFIPRWKMKQLYEPDYQNMPLCPVSREPVTLLPQEPPTPIGQTPDFHPTANAASDLQVPHATEMIV